MKKFWKWLVELFSPANEEEISFVNTEEKQTVTEEYVEALQKATIEPVITKKPECEHNWKLIYSNSEIAKESFYKCTKCDETKIVV